MENKIIDLLKSHPDRSFTTAEAASLAGLPGPRALRRLEGRGLVPAPSRSRLMKYRIYRPADIAALRARLAELGRAS